MANLLKSAVPAVALLVMLCGCNTPVPGLYPPSNSDSRDIYIVNNHWHTGFVLRADELSPSLRNLLPRFTDARYVEIGWGDDHFYRSEKSTSGLAMQALFASQGSVLHVLGMQAEPEIYYQQFLTDLYRIKISPQGERRLIAFIQSSFAVDDSGSAIELQSGWEPGSWFYKAHGKYFIFHTCNQWTADGLRQTGFPISPFYAELAGNVAWQIRTFGGEGRGVFLLLKDGEVQKTGP